MPGWKLSDAESLRVVLTAEQQKEIAGIYKKVLKNVRKELKDIPKEGTVSQQVEQMYLKELKKQLDKAYKDISAELNGKLRESMKEVSKAAVSDAEKWAQSVGLGIKGAFSNVPTEIVNAIAMGKVYPEGWSLSGALWSDVQKHQSDINKIIAEGVAANKSAYEIAKDLEQYVDPTAKKPWDWGKVYPGTAKQVDYNAQRLARTLVSHAYQQSLERVCKNNPFVDGYIWQATEGPRMCEICEERDGQFFPKGELPLDHPNGMCTFIASIADDNAVIDRLVDWVNGKDDPELDRWVNDLNGLKGDEAPKDGGLTRSLTGEEMEKLFREQDNEKLEQQLKEESIKWWNSLTSSEKAAIKRYTGSGYQTMNPVLRGILEADKKTQNYIDKCISALNKSKTSMDLVVGRGSSYDGLISLLGGSEQMLNAYKDKSLAGYLLEHSSEIIGTVVKDEAFTSTSPFEMRGRIYDVTYRIFVPEGTTGAYVGDYSQVSRERELLLQSGGMFRIVGIETPKGHDSNSIRVYMEYVRK